jgi:hypothetical protein
LSFVGLEKTEKHQYLDFFRQIVLFLDRSISNPTSHPTPALYFLKLQQPSDTPIKALIEIESHDGRWRSVAVQIGRERTFILGLHENAKTIRCASLSEIERETPQIQVCRLPAFLIHPARLARLLHQKRMLPVARKEYLFPFKAGDGSEQFEAFLTWAKRRQKLARLGLNDVNAYVLGNPELDEGWPVPQGPAIVHDSKATPRLAVVLHLFCEDVWPDFDAVLRNIPEPFDLFVSLTENNRLFIRKIEQSFPFAKIENAPNRGRDVAPFCELLNRGVLDQYELVCKIHGKKSSQNDEKNDVRGRRWRRRNLLDLLGSCEQVQAILRTFRSQPKTGLIGPSGLRIPNQ